MSEDITTELIKEILQKIVETVARKTGESNFGNCVPEIPIQNEISNCSNNEASIEIVSGLDSNTSVDFTTENVIPLKTNEPLAMELAFDEKQSSLLSTTDETAKMTTLETEAMVLNALEQQRKSGEKVPITPHLIAQTRQFESGNFFKGCKWSPDGLCFLTSSEDKKLHIYNTPYQVLRNEWTAFIEPLNLEMCVKVQEPETVYDFCWWPLMNSQDPSTCCFATTARDQPVHLWDAFDGGLRASYITLNSVQEVQAANSLCFTPDGQQLVCGFKKEVSVFYTDRPGSEYERWPTVKKKSRKSQTNIISCIKFGPDQTMFACGCYDGSVGLYSPVNGHLLDFTVAHNTGVTHMLFSTDGYRLYTGARKGHSIKCWDLRHLETPMFEMQRKVETHQRIYFDIINSDACELKIVSGSTDGRVMLWDIESEITPWKDDNIQFHRQKMYFAHPHYSFQAHNESVNGCDVHPYLPVIATSSGQRKFPEPCDSEDESEYLFKRQSSEENIVKLWHLPGCFPKGLSERCIEPCSMDL